MREIVAKADHPFVREEMAARGGHPILRGAGRAVQGRDPARHRRADASRSTTRATSSTSAAGPHVPSTGADQGLQAPLVLRRLLARGREEPDAPAHLRHRLAHPGGARQVPLARSRRRRSATTGSSGASSTCSMFHDIAPGRAVLAAQRHGDLPRARGVRARVARRARLPGDLDADPREQEAVGAVRALGALQRQHVQARGRGARPSA